MEQQQGRGDEYGGRAEVRTSDGPVQPAVVDLLGVLAYAQLSAFERLAADARLAPALADEHELAGMAAAEHAHYRRLRAHLDGLGVDPDAAMTPFRGPISAFHDSTAPSGWLEGLVKAYVGDAIGRDFYREVAQFVDPVTRDLVLEVLADAGHAEFVVSRVTAAVAAEPTLAGRLALWARRLVGEALAQAQRVAVDRDALASLIVGGSMDLVEVGRLFQRLMEAHSQRMQALGLSA